MDRLGLGLGPRARPSVGQIVRRRARPDAAPAFGVVAVGVRAVLDLARTAGRERAAAGLAAVGLRADGLLAGVDDRADVLARELRGFLRQLLVGDRLHRRAPVPERVSRAERLL